jgi:hypothetical protein
MKLKLVKLPPTKRCSTRAALGPCNATSDCVSKYSIATSLPFQLSSFSFKMFCILILTTALTTFLYYLDIHIVSHICDNLSSSIPPCSLVNNDNAAEPTFNYLIPPTQSFSMKSNLSFPYILYKFKIT